MQVHLSNGRLKIDQEGRSRKFAKKVQQKTFAASSANGREIVYVTERAVFRLREGKGLELTEVAPGILYYISIYKKQNILQFMLGMLFHC